MTATPDTIQFGVSQLTGERVARYAACPYCGSDIHRYPRMAWPHGHRMYHRCTGCTYGAWEHDETTQVLALLVAETRATRRREAVGV